MENYNLATFEADEDTGKPFFPNNRVADEELIRNTEHEDDLPTKHRRRGKKTVQIQLGHPDAKLPELPHISMPEMPSADSPFIQTIISLIHTVAAIFALYLSFLCNKGFQVGSFLAAGICPYIYILYVFAVHPDFCGIR